MTIDHIAMYVEDLERAREFFIQYFDAQSNKKYHNAQTGLSTYFLSFKSGARLEIMHRPRLSLQHDCQQQLGYSHLAFKVETKKEVDILTQRLKAGGYNVLSGPRTTGDGYYESCIVAIEDNLIEITC